jgi:tRNA (guanine10-N2)-dimethyltransferase
VSSDVLLSRYFALVSGEEVALARAEVESVLQLVDPTAKIGWDGTLGLFETTDSAIQFLLSRAATVKEAGYIIDESHSKEESMNWVSDDKLLSIISSSETFYITSKSMISERRTKFRKQLTDQLGTRIGNLTGAKVSSKLPDVNILVLLTQNGTLVCKTAISQIRKLLLGKSPSTRPFFHPSMMNAQLARVMCNLAGVMPGDMVIDPFCGSGGILSEIASLGARTIGMDLNWRLIMGAQTNLRAEKYREYSLIQGDARNIPLIPEGCDSIVTDPPYGRASSTRGSAVLRLVTAFLETAPSLLRKNGRLCIGGSSQMKLPELANTLGLECIHHIQVRVHRGLVRDIVTLQA